jgi:hypothetical protein
VAMVAEAEDRDMGRAPCVARNPTAYEQAGQKHGRTIPLGDIHFCSKITDSGDWPTRKNGIWLHLQGQSASPNREGF